MARYPVTKEGAEQLLTLATSLRTTVQRLAELSAKLNERIGSLNAGSSSELFAEIEYLAQSVAHQASEAEEPICQISNRLTTLSSTIIGMLGGGLDAGIPSTAAAVSGRGDLSASGNAGRASIRYGLTPGFGPYVRPKSDQLRDSRRATPHQEIGVAVSSLAHTNEPLVSLPDGGTRYDSPDQQADKLNWYQGLASIDYQGVCGLCSVQNIARMAGKDLSEFDVVSMAVGAGLCETGANLTPGERGGTDPTSRQRLLSLVGVSSSLDYNTSVEHIADLVENGRGVIVSVDVRDFWKGAVPFDQAGGHAVVVTSVDRNRNGEPVAFHICDSGLHDADYVVDADKLGQSIRRHRALNVTDGIIR